MFRALILVLALSACSTAQVTSSCQEASKILTIAQPYLSLAPIEVRAAAGILGSASVACGSAEYAAARDRVTSWLVSKGIKL